MKQFKRLLEILAFVEVFKTNSNRCFRDYLFVIFTDIEIKYLLLSLSYFYFKGIYL